MNHAVLEETRNEAIGFDRKTSFSIHKYENTVLNKSINKPANKPVNKSTNNPAIKRLSPISSQSSNQDVLNSTRLQTLLSALPAGVVVLDGKGFVNECNPAAIELLGEPLLGESWRDVIKRSFNPMSSGQDVITDKGHIVNITTCPLGNDLPGQIILLQDVTINRKLQEQVDQQKRLSTMGQMAAQLAHQIRTPIASALLYASHLKKSNLSEQNRIRFADKVLNRIQNLENLIKDMLLFSKNGMEQGSRIEIIDLIETIKNSINLKDESKINFVNKLASSEHFNVYGNKNLLVSAVLNLIENAEQSCLSLNHRAKIDVLIHSKREQFVDLSISDNGTGINKRIIKKIFEPFYTNKDSGTGLGLAVVKAISQGHKGNLWLENTSSKGSVFVLRLPLFVKNK